MGSPSAPKRAYTLKNEGAIFPGRLQYGDQGTWNVDGRKMPEPKEARALSEQQQAEALPSHAPWREQASCAPHNNDGRDISHLFLPVEGEIVESDMGMAICRACPVQDKCEDWIWEQSAPEYTVGVWGGNDTGRLTRKQKAARSQR